MSSSFKIRKENKFLCLCLEGKRVWKKEFQVDSTWIQIAMEYSDWYVAVLLCFLPVVSGISVSV